MKKLLISFSLLALGLALALPNRSYAEGGADLFKAKCAMCHGADGSGNTAMGKKFGIKDLSSADVQKASDADMTQIISKGKEKMPAYEGKLTKDQINELVKYIRTLKK